MIEPPIQNASEYQFKRSQYILQLKLLTYPDLPRLIRIRGTFSVATLIIITTGVDDLINFFSVYKI